jgi:NADH-quinone oxidoreductase subunit C
MNNLNLLSCVDFREFKGQEYQGQLGVVYHMSSLQQVGDSWKTVHRCALRTYAPLADPRVPSVARVWRTADWHEREGYGYPLRKDYKAPDYYNGMKVPY